MVYRTLKATALLAVLPFAVACGGNQPDPNVGGDGTDQPAEVKPPPPPPKCESLAEKCAAKKSTVAKVKSAALLFTPGVKWIYAQEETHTIAQVSEDGAALVLGGYTPDKDAKKDAAARDAAFDEVVKALGATPPKSMKINWKKPDAPQDVNGFKLGVWQVLGAERAGKKGILLVLQSNLDEGHALIGAGFAAEDDEAGMTAISESINSIKADPKKGDADKADDDKKDDAK